jgi:uncharacterized protein (TIGR01777 family)
MNVAITGSSGLIGKALSARLAAAGHEPREIRRGPAGQPGVDWDPAAGWMHPGALDGVDAVVHLAGASIGEGRWSGERKRLLRSSRIDSTRLLVSELSAMQRPPALVSASAVGYYGDRGDELLDECSGRGTGFLADLTAEWEAEALGAQLAGVRTAVFRLGVVLAADGGALPRMLLPFKLGAGGRLGSGRQWFSWVALDDVTSALVRAVESPMAGIFNLTSPNPVTNRDLTAALARVLRRPALMPVPAFALRVALGESADELLLASQRVLPRRLEQECFSFAHEEIESALRAVLARPA